VLLRYPRHLDSWRNSRPYSGFLPYKEPYSFSLFSTLAPAYLPLVSLHKYVLQDEKAFELEKMRIQMKAQKNTKKSF